MTSFFPFGGQKGTIAIVMPKKGAVAAVPGLGRETLVKHRSALEQRVESAVSLQRKADHELSACRAELARVRASAESSAAECAAMRKEAEYLSHLRVGCGGFQIGKYGASFLYYLPPLPRSLTPSSSYRLLPSVLAPPVIRRGPASAGGPRRARPSSRARGLSRAPRGAAGRRARGRGAARPRGAGRSSGRGPRDEVTVAIATCSWPWSWSLALGLFHRSPFLVAVVAV